jgi:hypothetical protein
MLAIALVGVLAVTDLDAAPEPESQRLELWTEPVVVGAGGVFSAMSGSQALVVPVGFEHVISGPLAAHFEASWLYGKNDGTGFRTNGFIAAIGLQWRFARAGNWSFFVEPRLVGGGVHQSVKNPNTNPFVCDDGCVVDTTAKEIGFGLVLGASTVIHGIYWSGVIGGQMTWFSGSDTSIVGLTTLVLAGGIMFPRDAWLVTPNLSLVRLGVAF